jgi:hypothetical protein
VSKPDAPDRAIAETSRYGPTFWVSVVLGWAAISYGVWLVVSEASITHPGNYATYFVGLALIHDLLVAPVALVVATIVRRVVPVIAVGIVLGALLISATVTAFAYPFFIRRTAAIADNPSFLPRNAGVGLLIVLAAVWTAAALMLLFRFRARQDTT